MRYRKIYAEERVREGACSIFGATGRMMRELTWEEVKSNRCRDVGKDQILNILLGHNKYFLFSYSNEKPL